MEKYDFFKKLQEDRNTLEPIYAGCPNNGPCFCTGACKKVVGYREKYNPLSNVGCVNYDPTSGQWKKWTDLNKKSGTRKVADLTPDESCKHPEHKPPMFQVFSPGHYEHTCPGCGHITSFTVNKPIW